jgi:thiol-disulfide isomerase/thioredoxin
MLSKRLIINTSGKIAVLLIVSLLFVSGCSQPADFHYLNNKSGRLDDFKGQWLLVNYWAEWCEPCIEEVPELNRFYKEYSKQYSMLSVSFDRVANENLKQQVKKYNMQYPVLASNPIPHLGIKMPAMLPANYIISPAGKRFGPLLGPQTVDSLLKAFEKAKHRLLSER